MQLISLYRGDRIRQLQLGSIIYFTIHAYNNTYLDRHDLAIKFIGANNNINIDIKQ